MQIPPWINPPNFLGAAQSGAQLGAQIRGQNIQSQEAAERMRLSFAEQAFKQQMFQQEQEAAQQKLQQQAIDAMMRRDQFVMELGLNRDKLDLNRVQGEADMAQRAKALDASILNQNNDNRRMDLRDAEIKRTNLAREALGNSGLEIRQQNADTNAEKAIAVETNPALDDAALDVAALNYSKTGQLPTLGYGKQAATMRANILNRAAKLNPELDVAGNRASYGSDSASLRKMQQQRDAIGAFENTAMKNIDVFLDTAGKVVDTGSPLANKLARSVSGNLLGSPDQSAYEAARQVAINEVAKIITNPNLSGVLSDSARHEVAAFSPESATLAQSVKVMRLLKRDMQNRTDAMDEQIRTIQERLSKGEGKSSGQFKNGERRQVPGQPGVEAEYRDGKWTVVK